MRIGRAFTFLGRSLAIVAVIFMAAGAGRYLGDLREPANTGQAGTAPTASPAPTAIPTLSAPGTAPWSTTTPIGGDPLATPFVKTLIQTPSPTPRGQDVSVSGRVTYDGRPVARAEIRVYPADEKAKGPTPVPPESAKAETDTDGRYTVRLPAGTYRIGAWLSCLPGCTGPSWWITWYGDALAIGLAKDVTVADLDLVGRDISMLPAITVTGRVVGHDGLGVPAADVHLEREGNWGVAYARTGGSGAFTTIVPGIPLKARVSASGTSAEVWTTVDLGADTSNVVVTLDRGHALSGVLRASDGSPLANIDFALMKADGSRACAYSCNGRTDDRGRYALTVPAGTFRFAVGQWWATPILVSDDITVDADRELDPALR